MNVEPLRHQVAEKRFGVRLNASVTSYAGNTQGVIFGGAALFGGRTERHFGYLDLAGDYTRLGGVVSVAKWFAHVRHNYELASMLWWEEFAQIESDRFRRVQLRELVGTGPRIGLFRSEPFELYVGTAYMFEHTKLDTAADDDAGQGSFHRWSNYVAATARPDDRISISSVSYIQPRFDEFSDYKVLSVNSVAFKVTDVLQSRLDTTVRYESVTPRDVEAADLELKSSLELVF